MRDLFSSRGDDAVDSDRGMSDAVVVLLLIGVAVIAVALIAVFVFGLVPTGDDAPTASLQFTQSADDNTTVTVYHGGGDDLPVGTTVEGTGAIDIDNVEDLGGLTPGNEATITLSAGDAGDTLSIVYEGSVIGSYDLQYDAVPE